jgi:type II secretory pathway component PulF/serine phosphatase RsbU (regulator of sigma subunit)
MSLTQSTTYTSNISREARRFFRDHKYNQLIQFLHNQERNAYLESLYQRAIQADKKEKELEKASHDTRKQEKSTANGSKFMSSLTSIKGGIMNHFQSSLQKEASKYTQRQHNKKQKQKVSRFSNLLDETLSTKSTLQKQKDSNKGEDSQLKKDLQNKEMEVAQNVQSHLIPDIAADILPGIETSVHTVSCTEISGDVYDFITHNKDESIFYLGDVTGHGTAAGLIMTMISVLTYAIVNRTKNTAEALITLNREIKPKLAKNMFASMIMCKWNAPLRTLSFSGAGHEYILHYHAKTKKVERIKTGGIAIGMLPDIAKLVQVKDIPLEHDDILMLYTDGLDEAWDKKGEHMYSLKRLEKDLKNFAELESVQDISDKMFDGIYEFQGNRERTDDMTLMLFRRRVSESEIGIKSKYEKDSLKESILKNEFIIADSANNPGPDIKKNQDAYVKDIKDIVALYIDEKKYFSAQQEIKKALRIQPQDQGLLELNDLVEKQIQEDNKNKGFFSMLKHKVFDFVSNIAIKKYDGKKEYLKLLQDKFHDMDGSHDIETMANIKKELKTVDPESSLLKKIGLLENKIQERKTITNLENFFSLDIASVKQDTELKDQNILQNKDQAILLQALQNQMVKNTGNEKKNTKEEVVKAIEQNYKPENVLGNSSEDVLGLHKILETKDNDLLLQKEKDIQGTSQKTEGNPTLTMEWNRDHSMKRRKQTYSKFMAKISPMNKKDLFVFINKLSAFVKAGISIQQSVEIMQTQAKNDGFIYVLDEIIKALESGKILSQAMKLFPQHFSEMLIYLVHAGEKSGALDVILEDIAEQMKEQQLIRGKIKSAMNYPIFIIIVSSIVLIGMLVFIVPRLVRVYEDTGKALPSITQMIVNISSFLQANYVFVIVGILMTFLGLYSFGKTNIGMKVYHKMFLYIPIVRTIVKLNNVMIFTTNSAILLQNGVQLIEVLNIIAKVTPNYYYKKVIQEYRSVMISKGGSLSEMMGAYSGKDNFYFPMEVVQTINTGEQTGALAKMMHSTGSMYKEELKTTVKGLSEIFEPFLMFVVGGMVAVILLAIMLPLFSLGKIMRQ